MGESRSLRISLKPFVLFVSFVVELPDLRIRARIAVPVSLTPFPIPLPTSQQDIKMYLTGAQRHRGTEKTIENKMLHD